MKNFMKWLKDNPKKAYMAFGGVIILILLLFFMYVSMGDKEEVVLKQDKAIVEVNTELNKEATTYLDGMKDPQSASIDFDEVDIKKVGAYKGIITYSDVDYTIEFEIVDTTKPVLSIEKTTYAFLLSDDVDDVNSIINKDIKITDNYDKEFEALDVVKEIPSEEKALKVKLCVKDTSGNESDPLEITVEFTEEESSDSSSSSGTVIADLTPKPTPTPEPTPVPEPDPIPEPLPEPDPAPQPDPTPEPAPTPEPETPSYTVPAGALDGGIFNSKEEARAWVVKIGSDPNSKYYGWMGSSHKLSNGQWYAYLTEM